ncbi:unnamed protein product [Parajaminaea phylloscopi]
MAFSFAAPSSGQQPSAGFSFGNTASSASTQPQQQQQQQQPMSKSGFSFGAPTSQAQTQQPQGQQANTFSFGQPAQASGNAGTSSAGMFGTNTGQTSSLSATGGLFGTNGSQQNKAAFSFGSSAPSSSQQPSSQQPFGQSQLGQSQLGLTQMGASSSGQQQHQQPQQDKKLGSSLSAKLETIRQAWDASNIQTCNFLTYFYNTIPSGVLPPAGPSGAGGGGPFDANANFGRRQDAVGPLHDSLWEKAVRENPDRTKLVPVLAVGFSDLKTRVEGQESEATRQTEHLRTISERLSALEQKHNLSDGVRASAAVKRQAALHHRVMALARKSHILVPALKGSSVTKEEESLRVKLEACEAELENSTTSSGGFGTSPPAGQHYGSGSSNTGRLRARVNELWVALGAVKARREMLEREGRKPGVEWAIVDEAGVEQVTNILGQQQQGLNHLIATLEEDTKALDTVLAGLKGVQLVGVRGPLRSS